MTHEMEHADWRLGEWDEDHPPKWWHLPAALGLAWGRMLLNPIRTVWAALEADWFEVVRVVATWWALGTFVAIWLVYHGVMITSHDWQIAAVSGAVLAIMAALAKSQIP